MASKAVNEKICDREIQNLITNGIKEAKEKYGDYKSPHEGWAVIREEVLEAKEYLDNILDYLDQLDECVRYDKSLKLHDYFIKEIMHNTTGLITEGIHIAVTAKRYKEAVDGKLNDFVMLTKKKK